MENLAKICLPAPFFVQDCTYIVKGYICQKFVTFGNFLIYFKSDVTMI